MKPTTHNNRVNETKLSKQFVEFIDLTDKDLEEINTPGFGRIQGGHHRHHHGCHRCHCGFSGSNAFGNFNGPGGPGNFGGFNGPGNFGGFC